tara:strand:+ start:3437 stop:3649 length:213 start_codon:yes stop_codon:yes gene_type:complete
MKMPMGKGTYGSQIGRPKKKAKMMKSGGTAKVKKVIKGLKKAVKAHSGQVKTLTSAIKNGKAKRPKSRNR